MREPRTAEHRRDGAGAHPQTAGHLAVAPVQRPLQAQNLSNASQGQSFRGHHPLLRRSAFDRNGDGNRRLASLQVPPSRQPSWVITRRGIGDHDPWNGRSRCAGMGDRDAVERPITMPWRAHQSASESCFARNGGSST